jgi:hypothetical protein
MALSKNDHDFFRPESEKICVPKARVVALADDRLIDRIAGHRRDQHPQRHLIRPHHHALAHERRPYQPPRANTITPRRAIKTLGQLLDQL